MAGEGGPIQSTLKGNTFFLLSGAEPGRTGPDELPVALGAAEELLPTARDEGASSPTLSSVPPVPQDQGGLNLNQAAQYERSFGQRTSGYRVSPRTP